VCFFGTAQRALWRISVLWPSANKVTATLRAHPSHPYQDAATRRREKAALSLLLPRPNGGLAQEIGEDHPEEEQLFRDLWEDETQREVMIESLKANCEIRVGRPPGL
jgi:hypothetical protein